MKPQQVGSICINLSIRYQDIEGLHNSLIGCKLNGQIDLINDIEILAETWSECEICKNITTENYALVDSIEPLKNRNKKGRASGGIKIYCKSYLKQYLKVKKTSSHYIWFEADKMLFQGYKQKPINMCNILTT